MIIVTEAIYDGTSLRLPGPVALPANSRVRVTIESEPAREETPYSFLEAARQADLNGPPDWSENLDSYVYGKPDADGT